MFVYLTVSKKEIVLNKTNVTETSIENIASEQMG